MTDLMMGVAAGVLVAGMCVIFYRKGVRDGMDVKKGVRPKAKAIFDMGGTDEQQSDLMKKYETILSYDPYGDGNE